MHVHTWSTSSLVKILCIEHLTSAKPNRDLIIPPILLEHITTTLWIIIKLFVTYKQDKTIEDLHFFFSLGRIFHLQDLQESNNIHEGGAVFV